MMTWRSMARGSSVKGWNAAERQALRSAVPVQGLKAPIRNTTAHAVAKDVLKLAADGLKRRKSAQQRGQGRDDLPRQPAGDRRTAASRAPERLLALYHGPWKRDLSRAFAEVRI